MRYFISRQIFRCFWDGRLMSDFGFQISDFGFRMTGV
jgi:hypothetical protein